MQISTTPENLSDYARHQINTFFPDGHTVNKADLWPGISDALERLEFCFRRIRVGRYCVDGSAIFNHLYSDQYLMFLWFLSNSLWRKSANENTLNKLYLLNKSLHSFDCVFDTPLPEVFIIIHGVGTVLGKAKYSDYLAVYHGCTVGQTRGKYPTLGRGVGLGAGASLLGNCNVGDYASIGAGCTLVNTPVDVAASAYRDHGGSILFSKTRSAAIAGQYFFEEFLFSPRP